MWYPSSSIYVHAKSQYMVMLSLCLLSVEPTTPSHHPNHVQKRGYMPSSHPARRSNRDESVPLCCPPAEPEKDKVGTIIQQQNKQMGGVYEEETGQNRNNNKTSCPPRREPATVSSTPFFFSFLHHVPFAPPTRKEVRSHANACAEIETRLRDDPAGPRFGQGLVGLANPTRQVAGGRTATGKNLGAKAQSPPVGRSSTRRVGVIDGRSLVVGNGGVRICDCGLAVFPRRPLCWGQGGVCAVPARMERGVRRTGWVDP